MVVSIVPPMPIWQVHAAMAAVFVVVRYRLPQRTNFLQWYSLNFHFRMHEISAVTKNCLFTGKL